MRSRSRATLAELERRLVKAKRRALCAAKDWADDVRPTGGVYAIWDLRSGRPVYVGETASLRKRMKDLERRVNHTGRRKLSAKLKLDSSTEAELSLSLAKFYSLSFLEVDLGRSEFEEYLRLRWRSRALLNSASPRMAQSEQYAWVVPKLP